MKDIVNVVQVIIVMSGILALISAIIFDFCEMHYGTEVHMLFMGSIAIFAIFSVIWTILLYFDK